MGPVSVPDHNPITSLCLSVIDTLDTTIIQFWEVKVVTVCKHLSRNKIITENIYKNTMTRLLYFKTPQPPFSDSKPFFFTLQRYKALDLRLTRDQDLYQYGEFMREYLNLGHGHIELEHLLKEIIH